MTKPPIQWINLLYSQEVHRYHCENWSICALQHKTDRKSKGCIFSYSPFKIQDNISVVTMHGERIPPKSCLVIDEVSVEIFVWKFGIIKVMLWFISGVIFICFYWVKVCVVEEYIPQLRSRFFLTSWNIWAPDFPIFKLPYLDQILPNFYNQYIIGKSIFNALSENVYVNFLNLTQVICFVLEGHKYSLRSIFYTKTMSASAFYLNDWLS